jgi:dihydropteroate synthase
VRVAPPAPAAPLIFSHRAGSWDLRERARVVGILNLTPDSFYDGGRYLDPGRALDRARAMIEEGADALDLGAQSTRPGAAPAIGAAEEWDRLREVVADVVALGVPVSVDTYRAEVARRALDAGVAIVNDVSGLTAEPEMARIAAEAGAGLVLMHAEGAPDRMHAPVDYEDVAGAVRAFLERSMRAAVAAGIPEERIALDPGIGFSKRAPQSLEALRGLPRLTSLGRPLYIGVSRKSFLAHVTRGSTPLPVEERLASGLGATVAALALGGSIFRTHDVHETVDAIRTAEAILNRSESPEPRTEAPRIEEKAGA